MKSKILLLFSLVIVVFSLTACQSTKSPIENTEFDMKFETLDKEKNVADFIIFGYPNEEEKEQILEVVSSSLKKQDLNDSIKVNLYSNFQDLNDNEKPFYGTLEYKDSQITKNNLKSPSEEEYLKYENY